MDFSPLTTLRFANAYGWQPGESNGSVGPETLDERIERLAKKAKEDLYAAAAGSSNDNGAFLAEFAVYTKVLYIRYRLPSSLLRPRRDLATQDSRRFKGNLEPATFIRVDNSSVGNLHFDITKEIGVSEIHRANLIMDLIENPYRVFQHLGTHEKKVAALAPVDPSSNIQARRQPGVRDLTPTYLFGDRRPQVIIEGASKPDLPENCGVCIDGQVEIVIIDGQEFFLIGGVLFKCYLAP